MTKGRAKGVRGELEVAKLLEGWWQQVESSSRFVRVPLSGGWGTPALRPDFKASGDIATNAKRFPFTVEVKWREGWTWDRLVKGRASPVWDWWRQAQTQAGECGLEPMLWFRRNREPGAKRGGHEAAPWSVMVRAEIGLVHASAHRHVFPYAQLLELDVGWHPVILRAERVLQTQPLRFLTNSATGTTAT